MTAPTQTAIPIDFGFSFSTFAQHLDENRNLRRENAEKCLTFGVEYLDRALGGIFPRDLVLVGADTGIGKTELVTGIARANARKPPLGLGKRVHGFFLECDDGEIQERIKWRLLSENPAGCVGSQCRGDVIK